MKRLSYILWGLETIALTSSMALMITALVCFAAVAALIVYVVFYRKGQRAVVLCPQCQIPMHQTLSSAITPLRSACDTCGASLSGIHLPFLWTTAKAIS